MSTTTVAPRVSSFGTSSSFSEEVAEQRLVDADVDEWIEGAAAVAERFGLLVAGFDCVKRVADCVVYVVDVEVDDVEQSDARLCEFERERRADPTGADDDHAGGLEASKLEDASLSLSWR